MWRNLRISTRPLCMTCIHTEQVIAAQKVTTDAELLGLIRLYRIICIVRVWDGGV